MNLKRTRLSFLFLLVTGTMLMDSCSKKGTEPAAPADCTGGAAAGPLFSAVRTLMNTNCVSCHNNTISNGGMNWVIDCNLVLNKARIKARAVDNNPTSMPPTGPLLQNDKDKITAWINAGGNFTD